MASAEKKVSRVSINKWVAKAREPLRFNKGVVLKVDRLPTMNSLSVTVHRGLTIERQPNELFPVELKFGPNAREHRFNVFLPSMPRNEAEQEFEKFLRLSSFYKTRPFPTSELMTMEEGGGISYFERASVPVESSPKLRDIELMHFENLEDLHDWLGGFLEKAGYAGSRKAELTKFLKDRIAQ